MRNMQMRRHNCVPSELLMDSGWKILYNFHGSQNISFGAFPQSFRYITIILSLQAALTQVLVQISLWAVGEVALLTPIVCI